MIRIPFDVNGNKMVVLLLTYYHLPYYQEIDCRQGNVAIWQINCRKLDKMRCDPPSQPLFTFLDIFMINKNNNLVRKTTEGQIIHEVSTL